MKSILAENVLGLMTTPKDQDGSTVDPETQLPYYNNLDYCIQKLSVERKMWTFVAHLTPTLFGVPVRRDRLFMLAIPRELFGKHSLLPSEATKVARQILDSLVVTEKRDLEAAMAITKRRADKECEVKLKEMEHLLVGGGPLSAYVKNPWFEIGICKKDITIDNKTGKFTILAKTAEPLKKFMKHFAHLKINASPRM